MQEHRGGEEGETGVQTRGCLLLKLERLVCRDSASKRDDEREKERTAGRKESEEGEEGGIVRVPLY